MACGCRNKTESKLYDSLRNLFPEATITPQHPGPKLDGQTHFDFLLTFPDGFEVLIELDGPQHFWVGHFNMSESQFDEACKRDLAKEKWAVQRRLCVVRVLQENVWNDEHDWQGWLVRSISKARVCEPQPITPDAPEYRSADSGYVKIRCLPNDAQMYSENSLTQVV